MTQKKKYVLFVDDDATLLGLVRELLGSLAGDSWEILTATDTAQALSILHENVIDLVITDVHMPVVDGLQFLKLLQRKYPNVLKVVLTGDTTAAYRVACLSNGAELYLEKPRAPRGWEIIYATLNELIKFQPEEGFRGVLRKVGLQEVIQLECLACKSSILEVKARNQAGQIYIEDGRIIHAEAGERSGTEALNFILSRTGGEFNLKLFVEPSARTINDSWESLLMDAAQKMDEFAPDTSSSPGGGMPASALQDDTVFILKMAQAQSEVSTKATPQSAPARGGLDSYRPKLEEMLVCSAHGEVLYDWQCANTSPRIVFLEFLSQKARQLAQGLPLGFFDRLEVEDANVRILTHVAADRAIFLRTSKLPLGNVG